MNKRNNSIIIILLSSILAVLFYMAFLLPVIVELELVDGNKIVLMIAIATYCVTIFGWFLNSYWNRKSGKDQAILDRKLQQKQLAIQILHENRFQKQWITSRRKVFTALRSATPPDWVKLHQDYMSDEVDLSDSDNKMYQAFVEVLNYFEFTSIAVKNNAIDADIFKWSYKGHFRRVYRMCPEYFALIAEQNPDAFCNYLSLCEKWFPKKEKDLATPTD